MSIKTVIEADALNRRYWRDLWAYRELLYVLAWRDVSVHYKQTAIGIAWAVLRPVLTILVFTFVFGRIARLPSDGVPYLALVLCGMLPWQLFATTLGEASNSLVANGTLISKVYFPRMLVPFSSVAVGLVDFLICLPILAAIMIWNGIWPTWRLLALPPIVALVLLVSIAASLWLAALNVRFRDVRYVIPFLVQFGLYLSPVGYSSTAVPAQHRWAYHLNPLAGLIDAVRWSILGTSPPFGYASFYASLAAAAVFLVGGVWYFRRTERTFADVI